MLHLCYKPPDSVQKHSQRVLTPPRSSIQTVLVISPETLSDVGKELLQDELHITLRESGNVTCSGSDGDEIR